MIRRMLFVGDPHVTPEDVSDAQNLIDLVIKKAKEEGFPGDSESLVVFLGDLHHTHAVVRIEVLNFWTNVFNTLDRENIYWTALVGNHDMPGSSHAHGNSLVASKRFDPSSGGGVISDYEELDGFLFMAYQHDPNRFVDIAKRSSSHTIICHQTFNGATYENGFYAKEGIDLNLINQKQIISGHIHKEQEFSKCWYVGSSRWRSLSDANEKKSLQLVDFDNEGKISKRIPFNTGDVCRQIRTLEDREGGPATLPSTFDPRHEWRVDIYGTACYIEERSAFLKAQGCKVRTFRTELDQPTIRESEGVDKAFTKWIQNYQPQHGTDKAALEALVKERLQWQAV